MPSHVALPENANGDPTEEPSTEPLSLPITLTNVRVVRGDTTINAPELRVNGDSISWGDGSVSGSDIVLHGIMSDEPSCVYAQLESGGEVRFSLAAADDLNILFRALSAVAVIAEEAVQALEEPGDDEMYTRRPDGTVGTVDWDAMLAVDSEILRYQDAEEGDEEEQSGDSGK